MPVPAAGVFCVVFCLLPLFRSSSRLFCLVRAAGGRWRAARCPPPVTVGTPSTKLAKMRVDAIGSPGQSPEADRTAGRPSATSP